MCDKTLKGVSNSSAVQKKIKKTISDWTVRDSSVFRRLDQKWGSRIGLDVQNLDTCPARFQMMHFPP